jgi:hypothetical protein
MAMHLTATLYEETVLELLGQLLPLTMYLDAKKKRWVQVNRPDEVSFIAGEGLRLTTSAKVQWTLAGVSIPFTIRLVQVMVRPEVVDDELGGKLLFRVQVEDADLKGVPSAIDDTIVSTVNARLSAIGDKIGWNFGETLRRSIGLPPSMHPVEAFQMRAQEGKVVVTDDAMTFSLYTPSRFKRAEE